MWLSAMHKHILTALACGSRLQDHRDLMGTKIYQLHPLDGDVAETVAAAVVETLQRQRLVESNMKFPAATYLLTDKGAALAAKFLSTQTLPLHAKNYTAEP